MEEDVKHVAPVLGQVERVAEQVRGGAVPGEQVEVAAENECGQSHCPEHSLRVLGDAILLAAFRGFRLANGACQGHQVAVLRRIETQCVGDRVEQGIGGFRAPALLQTLVVVSAQPGEDGDLLAPQPIHPTTRPRLQAEILRSGSFPTRAEEGSEFSRGRR